MSIPRRNDKEVEPTFLPLFAFLAVIPGRANREPGIHFSADA
jgi:hypothetical protein